MKEIDVKLTEEEFRMVQYCIEFISANQRDFDEDGEKALKSIAEKFNAEYVEEVNMSFYN
jgi:intein-encoded DNA endonuclease-like protein